MQLAILCGGAALAAFVGSTCAHAQCLGWSDGNMGAGVLGNVSVMRVFDDGQGPRLFVGGYFTQVDGMPASHVAAWDGTSWSDVGGGRSGPVWALAVHDDGGGPALHAAGATGVARWDGTSWSQLPSSPSQVSALASFDDGTGAGPRLFVGGAMLGRIRVWNGTFWDIPGGMPFSGGGVRTLAVFDAGNGPELVAGGSFTRGPIENLARWDGSSWRALGASFDGSVEVLEVLDLGGGPVLHAGGAFRASGSTPADLVAAWGGQGWRPVAAAFPQGGTGTATVRALGVFDDGGGAAPLAGGTLPTVNGGTSGLFRREGTAWVAQGVDGSVFDLARFADGGAPGLHVGGTFSAVDGVAVSSLARLFASHRPGCPDPSGITFCSGDGSATACPCGNTGAAGHGCDNPQSTGGVRAELLSVDPDGFGAGQAILRGTGYPVTENPTVVAMRSTMRRNNGLGTVFADGLLCVEPPIVRVGTAFADRGSSTLFVNHGAGPGTFSYQLWYRSSPASFCSPAGSNTSNGVEIVWP